MGCGLSRLGWQQLPPATEGEQTPLLPGPKHTAPPSPDNQHPPLWPPTFSKDALDALSYLELIQNIVLKAESAVTRSDKKKIRLTANGENIREVLQDIASDAKEKPFEFSASARQDCLEYCRRNRKRLRKKLFIKRMTPLSVPIATSFRPVARVEEQAKINQQYNPARDQEDAADERWFRSHRYYKPAVSFIFTCSSLAGVDHSPCRK
ncbi:hypothetical protein CPB83DRAFT_587424 [Crepidotus variabilis]|uniref:Uncharacterized protein n=1 Tax=Crepidotus variabilis TaxID=179855 RepID=A0A9P6EQM5_9AGAR|nr:hypothetical protein CPB83DRAFT_587424 [Crepidotus variabilis]